MQFIVDQDFINAYLSFVLSWPNFKKASFFPIGAWTLLGPTKKVESALPPISFSWKSADHSRTDFPVSPHQLFPLAYQLSLKRLCLSLLAPAFILWKKNLFLIDSETLPDVWDQSGLPITTVFILNKSFPYQSPNLIFWHQ